MTDFTLFWEWMAFAVRWTHVIVGVAWIGSSFYFIALDLGLRSMPTYQLAYRVKSGRCMGADFITFRNI